MFLRTTVALAAALNAPAFALAQSSAASAASSDTDFVVTASRAPEAQGRQVRPVQVLTAEDIRQAGAGSLTELLRTLGGVEIASSGGLGQPSSLFMRGANSDHTVVLLDGVRIGSATLGTAALDSVPLAMIERVELLAGPSSSLYGSDAIGGVIQIFTKSSRRSPGLNLAVTVGQPGLRQMAAAYAGRHGDTELSLGATWLDTDGDNVTTPANTFSYNPDRDGYRQHGAHARLSQDLAGGHQVGLQWLRSDGTVHYDDGPGIDAYAINRTQTLAAFWRGPMGGSVQSEFRLARAWDDADARSSFPGYVNTRQDQASWLHRIALGRGTLTAGLEWLRQSVDSDTPYSVTERSIRSALLGWRAAYGAVSVQADARHDDNSQFGAHTTAQVAAAWQVDPAWRLRASAGSAFRAPSFNLLYYPGFGNPGLKPERANSLELGLDGRLAGLDLGATWFDNRMRELIDYAPPTFAPVNIARAGNRGLALTAAGSLGPATRAKANLTWQDPQNRATGEQLQRRARWFGGLQLSHTLGAMSLGGDLTWVGQRYDSATEAPASRMGGYGLLAVFGSWRMTPDWSLEARVNNLGDKAYETAQGYVSPGRQGQVTLRWTPAL
jgi:vitamin B12 transporter